MPSLTAPHRTERGSVSAAARSATSEIRGSAAWPIARSSHDAALVPVFAAERAVPAPRSTAWSAHDRSADEVSEPGTEDSIPTELWRTLPLAGVQEQLTLGERDAPDERHADMLADVATSADTPLAAKSIAGGRVSRTSASTRLLSGGEALPSSISSNFSSRFGQDFSGVRVHAGPSAASAARSINARAFTIGQDIVFAPGEYTLETSAGRHLLAHELAHTLQHRSEAGRDRHPTIMRQPMGQEPPESPLAQRPQDCPTYEMWISSFRHLESFRDSITGHEVLGRPAHREPLALGDPSPTDVDVAAGEVPFGDRWIDHPTGQWLRDNLPPELIRTAYELPADCADVALVLRHVWLAAHRRSETYPLRRSDTDLLQGRSVTIGVGAGSSERARQLSIHRVLQRIGSGWIAAMVQEYTDRSGRLLRSFGELAQRLHPGDLLVWEHRLGTPHHLGRVTGGHVQTVQSVHRAGSFRISVLQGNQPIYGGDVLEIEGQLQLEATGTDPERRRLAIAEQRRIEGERGEDHLRESAARRVERSSHSRPSDLSTGVWGWIDGPNAFTQLVVAGPPRSAGRPRTGRRGRRRVTDWLPALRRARTEYGLRELVEATLTEARSHLDGDEPIADEELRAVGAEIENRLHSLSVDQSAMIRLIRAFAGRTADGRRLRALSTGVRLARHDAPLREDTVAQKFDVIITAMQGHRPAAAVVRRQTQPQVVVANGIDETTMVALVRAAHATNLVAVFRQQLDHLDAQLAAGQFLVEASARALGRAAGERLWVLATSAVAAGGFGNSEHFDRLHLMRASVRRRLSAPSSSGPSAEVLQAFTQIDDELNMAGRGVTDLGVRGGDPSEMRVLITGFDPFTPGGVPDANQWNPSGAAALALDGCKLETDAGRTVRIESVVYPVSFAEFAANGGEGIVERVVGARVADFDAVITVSMNMSTGSHHPVEIEHVAVGVHALRSIQTHQRMPTERFPNMLIEIPPAARGRAQSVIESNADLEQIAEDAVEGPGSLAIDSAMRLRFPSTMDRDAAMALTGRGALAGSWLEGATDVVITDRALVSNIVATQIPSRGADDRANHVRWRIGNTTVAADIVEGPGGSFLSNEVAYRTQRALGVGLNPRAPASFHVHTEGAPSIASPGDLAATVRRRVISAVQQVVIATASASTGRR